MKRILIITISLMLSVLEGTCQKNDSITLNVKEALRLSYQNMDKLKVERRNILWAENEVAIQKSASLPQLSAVVDWRYNPTLQTTLIPNDQGVDEALTIDTKFNTLAGVSLSYDIYNPASRGDLAIKKASVTTSKLELEKVKEQVTYDVLKAYFNALFQREKWNLSLLNKKLSSEQLKVTKSNAANKTITSNERIKAEVAHSNVVYGYRQDSLNYISAMESLKYLTGIQSGKQLLLEEDIETIYNLFQIVNSEPTLNKNIRLEQQKLAINNLEIKRSRSMVLPTLSLYGNYSFQYLNDRYRPSDDNSWYPFSYVGVKLSVALFDGGQRNKRINGFTLKNSISNAKVDQLKSEYSEEARLARTQMKVYTEEMRFRKKNLSYMREVLESEKASYKSGTILLTDLQATEYLLKTAQTNYLNTFHNFLIALLRQQSALGSLTKYNYEED